MPDGAILASNLALGLFAFFSPCGFPMLPAYMAYYLARPAGEEREPLPRAALRGLGGGLLAALGALVVLLAIGGLAVALGAPFKQRVIWLELVGGLVVLSLGVAMLAGKGFSLQVAMRPARSRGALSLVGFGALYAATAASCTAPVLLGVLIPAWEAPSVADGIAQVGAYAVGMSILLVVASVLVATSQDALLARAKRILPHVERALGAILVAAGAYLIWYWAAVELGIPAPPSVPVPF